MKAILLRKVIGETLREQRVARAMTLRDVAHDARVSLGYLSEVERGQKEASSELLYSITVALGLSMSELLMRVAEKVSRQERSALSLVAA